MDFNTYLMASVDTVIYLPGGFFGKRAGGLVGCVSAKCFAAGQNILDGYLEVRKTHFNDF